MRILSLLPPSQTHLNASRLLKQHKVKDNNILAPFTKMKAPLQLLDFLFLGIVISFEKAEAGFLNAVLPRYIVHTVVVVRCLILNQNLALIME